MSGLEQMQRSDRLAVVRKQLYKTLRLILVLDQYSETFRMSYVSCTVSVLKVKCHTIHTYRKFDFFLIGPKCIILTHSLYGYFCNLISQIVNLKV